MRNFLRTIPLHRTGVVSFGDLSTVDDMMYGTYPDTSQRLGLLMDAVEWKSALRDGFEFSCQPFTKIFALIISHWQASDSKRLFVIHNNMFHAKL